jgi:hypothetical protein
MTDDGVTAFGEGETWRWHWRAPWTAETMSPVTYKTEAAALAAGRKWLAKQSQPTRPRGRQ